MTPRYVIHTGPLDKAPAWLEAFKADGIDAVVLPAVRTEDVPPDAMTDENVARGAPYALIMLTSRRAAYVLPRWKRHLAYAPVAVVGKDTAYGASSYGFPPNIVGEQGAEELAARVVSNYELNGKSVLWPGAESPLPILRERLEAAGAAVTAPVVYRTVREPVDPRRMRRIVGEASAVVFTSPTGVEAFAAAADAAGQGAPARRLFAACLGASTAAAADRAGFVLRGTADRPDPAGVAQVLRTRRLDERF